MIQLRTLGSTELSRPDGTAAASVLAQPKRLALLAYLAIASPRGYHRRDTLLAMFWPDSDAERARGALRQALRFLRQSLGSDVIVNRGEDEIGIGPGTLHCDVVAFENALDSGDAVAALDHCRGPLLDGFFVDASPQWPGARPATSAVGVQSAPHARFARSRVLAAVAFVIVVLGLAGDALLPACAAPAAEHRVLVTPFENMTGSHEADPLGYMAADWVTQGMAGVGLIEVVSLPSALRAEAERISEWLLRPGVKYLWGEHTYARARIAALLGEREHAVSLLGEAFSQGLQQSPVYHREQDLASLHSTPPFEALMRPR